MPTLTNDYVVSVHLPPFTMDYDNYLNFLLFTSCISFMVSFATPDIPLYSPSSRNSFGAIGAEERVG